MLSLQQHEHTISCAFSSLQRSVPTIHNQIRASHIRIIRTSQEQHTLRDIRRFPYATERMSGINSIERLARDTFDQICGYNCGRVRVCKHESKEWAVGEWDSQPGQIAFT